MKVTVDTRHDSLEEALATVRAAFGSSGKSSSRSGLRGRSSKAAGSVAASAKRDGSGRRSLTRPAAKRGPGKTAAVGAPKVNGKNPTSSMRATSNVAPPGQADAIRAWAKAEGMEVKEAGRLPAAVIRAYQESSAS